MRLTTKIFLGFLGFILACIIGFIFFIKTYEQDTNPYIKQEDRILETIRIDAYKNIQINTGSGYFSGTIKIKDIVENEVQINKDSIMNIETHINGDTLYINLNINNLDSLNSFNANSYTDIIIPVKDSLKLLVNTNSFKIDIDNTYIESLDLEVCGVYEITMSSSIIKKLKLNQNHEADTSSTIVFHINDTQIDSWYIKNTYIDYWNSTFNSSSINELSISGESKYDLPKWKYNVLNWEPLTEGAQLTIELKEASSITKH